MKCSLTAATLGMALCATPSLAEMVAPFDVSNDQGVFLIVTDIHFDPFALPDIVPDLDAADVPQWAEIFAKGAGDDFENYGSDAGYPLTASALKAASELPLKYDYVLYTGDYLSHDFELDYNRYAGRSPQGLTSFSVKTAQYVSDAINTAVPDVPLIGIMGNTDAICGDYMIAPESDFTKGVKSQWMQLTQQPDAFDHFDLGGYYKVEHPTVPDHDIIVLNDIFWSTKYQDACDPNGSTPGDAMMAWLEFQLFDSKVQGRKVHLLLHIPPGVNAYSTSRGFGSCESKITPFWDPNYGAQFIALMHDYADVVDYSFSGHTHMDSFSIINDANGNPNIAGHITPAISPIFGNNPAFTAYLYDRTNGDILDSATFYLNNLEDAAMGAKPIWQLEYVFSEAYGTTDMSAESLVQTAKVIKNDNNARNLFKKFYAASTDGTNPISDSNVTAFLCAQTAVSPEKYKDCYCSSE